MAKISSYQQFVTEKAISLSSMKGDIGILVKEEKVTHAREKRLVLYDFTNKKIVAYIGIKRWYNDKTWEMMMVIADKNFGPSIYDSSMMAIYPQGLRPSRVIKEKAIGVWKYYMEHRNDVSKKPVKKEDEYKIYSYDNDHKGLDDEETLAVLNTEFSMKPTKSFKDLVDKGKSLSKKYKVDIDEIIEEASEHFWKEYDHA